MERFGTCLRFATVKATLQSPRLNSISRSSCHSYKTHIWRSNSHTLGKPHEPCHIHVVFSLCRSQRLPLSDTAAASSSQRLPLLACPPLAAGSAFGTASMQCAMFRFYTYIKFIYGAVIRAPWENHMNLVIYTCCVQLVQITAASAFRYRSSFVFAAASASCMPPLAAGSAFGTASMQCAMFRFYILASRISLFTFVSLARSFVDSAYR
jgi:hypothetical protein